MHFETFGEKSKTFGINCLSKKLASNFENFAISRKENDFFLPILGQFDFIAFIWSPVSCYFSKPHFSFRSKLYKPKHQHKSNLFLLSKPDELLLFFVVYVICKKNYYSFSRVVFLFFQSKIAKSFYSKINDSSRVRTTAFSSSRFGVRVSVVPNIFTIYPQHFLIPEISETLKGYFTKFFGTVKQKIFDGKL